MNVVKTSAKTIYDVNGLSRMALFRDLTEPQLRQLSESLNRKTCSAGTMLMAVEQPREVVYFILRGTVKIHQDTGLIQRARLHLRLPPTLSHHS
jgi:signal-transduction protein with cAMP-binding, CBS, and nucleotidyltransferase domain